MSFKGLFCICELARRVYKWWFCLLWVFSLIIFIWILTQLNFSCQQILDTNCQKCSTWYSLFATLTSDSVVHLFDVAVVYLVSLLSFCIFEVDIWCRELWIIYIDEFNLAWLWELGVKQQKLKRDCVGCCTVSYCKFLVLVYAVQS